MEESTRSGHFESAVPQIRRKRITRKISRTLSLVVTRVPSLLNVAKFKELGSRDNLTQRTDKRRRPRQIDVTLIVPDKSQRNILGRSPQTIQRLIQSILDEFHLDTDSCCLRLAGSKASVDPLADVALLEGDVLVIEETNRSNVSGEDHDSSYKITEKFLQRELSYITDLQSSTELYGIPLRRLEYLADSEYEILFDPLIQLADVCSGVTQQISNVLPNWANERGKIGAIFSSEFWDQYEKYQEIHRQARELLREKNQDEEFVDLCRHRRGAAQYTLESILQLPVQRLAQYELYFQSLLNESRQHHEYDTQELIAAKNRANQAVRRGQEESDLERIQDLFPNDCLYLYDKDVVTMKMKGLMRKRSGTASRLQRALSAKSLRHEDPPRTPAPGTDTRTFLMEAPVQFCTGVQSQDRHLFLFNDLLLVAKARSGGNFKLKEKVRVSEIWMSKSCIDEVTELSKSPDTSFALGWPTTNVVAVFSTQASRDLWWTKLNEVLVTERMKEPPSTNIQVIYYDHNTNIEYCKTFMVGPEETAKGCIKAALAQLGLDGGQFQLWVKTARDEAPYPLIGHERPFAIKLSCLRDGLAAEEGFDLDHCNNIHDPLARCHFILRNSASNKSLEESKKSSKKTGRISLGQVFRRSITKENPGCLFGLPLSRIMEGDNIPKPVASMLLQIFHKGPFTQGIFRKSANARLVRELREKLDLGEEVSFEHVPVLVTAALLKEFLRSLPDPLLTSSLYPQYRAALNAPNTQHKLHRLKGVLQQLPKANYIVLSHFLCVLHHISRRSAHNLMSSSNLGVCVGPSLIWGSNPSIAEDLRLMPALVDCLITNCEVLMGSHVSHLLGDPRDSGTEESDSLRRDDSSIDSLECSPPPRKDKISLSRDSGLTMSDSQLYTPDEEESGSTSSSGYDPAPPLPRPHYEVTPSLSMPTTGEYVRVYGGWEERLNPNFSRQAWFRQRSRRLHNTKPEVQRCASEESLLDNPPPTPPRRNKPQATPPTPLTPKSSFVLSKYSTPLSSQHSNNPPYDLYVNTPVPSYSTTDLYQPVFNTTHPPLRKVTAVHCEVIPDRNKECGSPDDSSTLSDDDCTPHVSRSNSRGNEVSTKLRHLPPVHVETCYVRGRLKRKEERAHRSRSLPPPPPYRPPPPALSNSALNSSTLISSPLNNSSVSKSSLNNSIVSKSSLNNSIVSKSSLNNSIVSQSLLNSSLSKLPLNNSSINKSSLNNSSISKSLNNNSSVKKSPLNSSISKSPLSNSTLRYNIARAYMDEESYV